MAPNERLTAFLLVVVAICLTVTGETFLKTGMNRVGAVHFHQIMSTVVRVASTWQVWVGFLFAFGGALLWLAALSRAPLSWAYPILSLGYILVLILSKVVLHEEVSLTRWIGTAVVVCGIWLVFQTWK
jgi:multidrug transporter EmrE-like cation transporter